MSLGEPISDYTGKIIAWYEYLGNGDIIVKDFYGHILGKYIKDGDITCDFYGKIVAHGNAIGMLIKPV